jgi:hypothetical protein
VNLAEARAAATDPKIKAVVETAPDLPLRDSESADFQVFSTIRDAAAHFKELYEGHEALGFVVTTGNKTRGFAILERGDELLALNLDKRSAHDPPNEG